MKKNRFSFYEFFAGGGMARAGLGEQWHCSFANDNSPQKHAAYVANYGADDVLCKNVEQLSLKELPGKPDLAWASFPCQDLSLAGDGAGLKGERSGTFWAFWNLIKKLGRERRQPNIVVLENVFGALTSHGGKDFDAILDALISEGYFVGALVIDAVHFVPQSRPRLFVIGAKKILGSGLIRDNPDPAWHTDAVIRAFNRIPKEKRDRYWRWWSLRPPTRRLRTLEDIVQRDPEGVEWNSEADTNRLLRMMTPLNRRKVLAAQASGRLTVGTIYRRTRDGIQRAEVRFDGVSGCLRTPSGGSSRQTIVVVEGASVRTRLLSPREAARLMGLRDNYILPTRYNDAYHLAGDGVVVPVVAHLSRYLLTPLARMMSAEATRAAA
jgi:DNA (cytosine-5)-methyltransferase 1